DVPVFGRAVQAPIVIAPNVVPRVDVIQVAPRPIPLASNNTMVEMKISLTSQPSKSSNGNQFLRDEASAAAEARLSGNGSDVVDAAGFGPGGGAVSGSVLAASSIAFSTCTRISAPRRVRIGGGAEPGSVARAMAACADVASGI